MFDYCISNPPYQDQNNRPIYHHFHTIGSYVSHHMTMIYMARWWNGTSGLKHFLENIISRKTIHKVTYYDQEQTSNNIFPGTQIAGGITIVENTSTPTKHFTLSNGKDYSTLKHKDILDHPIQADKINQRKIINNIIRKHGSLRQRNHPIVNELRLTAEQLQSMNPKPTTNTHKPENGNTIIYANIVGGKGGRSNYYLVKGIEHRNTYAVCCGQSIVENENRPLRTYILQPHIRYGRSSVGIGFFNTKEEAENFLKYTKTEFFETAFRLSLAGRLATLLTTVPDIGDYSNSNPTINWSKPLDPQLENYFS